MTKKVEDELESALHELNISSVRTAEIERAISHLHKAVFELRLSQRPEGHMDIGEFRRLGLLQEVNRRFFHPIGLALAVNAAKDDAEPITETLAYIIDCRDDPEGFMFCKLDVSNAISKAVYYDHLVRAKIPARRKLFTNPDKVLLTFNGVQPIKTMGMENPDAES